MAEKICNFAKSDGGKIALPTVNLSSVEYSNAVKIGSLLVISLRGLISNLTTSGMQVATLPTGWYPNNYLFGSDWSTGRPINWQIWPTGEVYAFTLSDTYSGFLNLSIYTIL